MSYESLVKKIQKLAKAETMSKALLGELSRELLADIIETKDVRAINMLLGDNKGKGFVLSPVNWRFACKYFLHFLPFTSNYDEVKDCINKGGNRSALVFKKLSPKKWEAKLEEIQAWLADENNDIWVWSNSVQIEEKPVDYAARITKNVTAAQEKGGLDVIEIMQAVVNAGIDAEVLMRAIAEIMPQDMEEVA